MIFDLDAVDASLPDINYDFCIAGAGFAGIVLAVALSKMGYQIVLLEGGDVDFWEDSQELYQGTIIGRDYVPLDATRLRQLGGTSGHWAGSCRPLSESVFKRHPHIPDSGWPISKADLAPFLKKTCEILEIETFPADEELPGSEEMLNRVAFRKSPPVRFNEKYSEILKYAENITLVLKANLTGIKVGSSARLIEAFEIQGYIEGREARELKARAFVLALGGIENARILLNVRERAREGLWQGTALAGRYFAEHPHHALGQVVAEPVFGLGTSSVFVEATPDLMRREKIGNCILRLEPAAKFVSSRDRPDDLKSKVKEFLCSSELLYDLAISIRPFRCPRTNEDSILSGAAVEAGIVRAMAEQAPNPDSRVLLSDERDRFGLRRVALDWQLSAVDKRTMARVGMEFGKAMARSGLGRVKLADWILDEDSEVPGVKDGHEALGNHHMGTTRMATSAQEGVVDQDCKVYGKDNLFIAGSSVFTTGGAANPTFTIVQLALRLSSHLATRFPPRA